MLYCLCLKCFNMFKFDVCYAPWLEKDVTKMVTQESANNIQSLLTK